MPGIRFIRGRHDDGDGALEYVLLSSKTIKWSLLIPVAKYSADAWCVDFASFMTLFLVRCLKVETDLEVFLLVEQAKSCASVFCVPGKDVFWFLPGGDFEVRGEKPQLSLDILGKVTFNAPVLVDDGKNVVAGACAVLRRLLVEYSKVDGPWRKMATDFLGFRSGCLQAPSQTSPWARFCETDAPEALGLLRAAAAEQERDDPPIIIPTALAKLEEHFRHPIRCHNVRKKKQDERRRKGLPIERNADSDPPDWKVIDERFVEGADVTLADLMLLTSVHLSFYCLNRSIGKRLLPKCDAWLKRLFNEPRLQDAILVLNEAAKDLPKAVKVCTDLPDVPRESLYKRDPERYDPKRRIYTRQGKLEEVFARLATLSPLPVDDVKRLELPWSEFPNGINLAEDHLPANRLDNKKTQIENMAACLKDVVRQGDTVVEFCCGSGHLGLVVAHLFPGSSVILVDSKQQSLERAAERARDAELNNVAFALCNLEHFRAKFDVGLGLHACGSASDLIIAKCVENRSSFVVGPCCYGAVSFVKPKDDPEEIGFSFSYPQSKAMAERLDYEDYLRIAHSSDQNHEGCSKEDQGRICMSWVDSDRLWAAAERGFRGRILRMTPHGQTSLKDHILVGVVNDQNGS